MWKRKIVCLGLTGALLLAGCESAELEQRSFPLAVGIDLQETGAEKVTEAEEAAETAITVEADKNLVVTFDFPDLTQVSEKSKTTDTSMGMSLEGMDMYHVEKSYENNTNRLLDYNHMKAVVLGEDILENQKQLRSLLLAWEQREASARNISLLIAGGPAAEILSLTEETEGSMGKYLEEMLESQKDFKQNKIATMGDLMNQWHNQDELLLIPVLTEEGKRPVITGYAAVQDFDYCGNLTVEEAMRVFLCQNLMKKFTCETVKNQVVEISDIQVAKTVDGQADSPIVTVSITGKGKIKTGQSGSVAQQYQLEQRIEKQLTAELQETAGKLTEEYGIDMTNSYISLGGLNREFYKTYQEFPELYHQRVQQVFTVDIDLLNWE